MPQRFSSDDSLIQHSFVVAARLTPFIDRPHHVRFDVQSALPQKTHRFNQIEKTFLRLDAADRNQTKRLALRRFGTLRRPENTRCRFR